MSLAFNYKKDVNFLDLNGLVVTWLSVPKGVSVRDLETFIFRISWFSELKFFVWDLDKDFITPDTKFES